MNEQQTPIEQQGAPVPQQYMPPAYNNPPAAAQEKPQREYTPAERMLLPLAIIIGILYDRLVFKNLFDQNIPFFAAIFWIAYLVIFYAYNWQKLKKNAVAWVVAGFTALCCAWNFIFDYNSGYGILTFLVIPCVCMAHAVYTGGGYSLKRVGAMALDWLCGWVIKPFTAIPTAFGTAGSFSAKGKNETLKKVLVGVLITLPLLFIILPLLSSADRVFGYYIGKVFRDFSLPTFVGHIMVALIAAILFFSFFWNIRFAKPLPEGQKTTARIDTLISSIILGVVLLVYVLFCFVQFTYLFAGAGLPNDMTYSEYAREGFFQLIVVAGLNLLLFAVFLNYGKRDKLTTGMLAALLAVTAVMLVSGALRLKLYTDQYGLTWLRLLSAWFICYLAVVIGLCVARMVKEEIPLVAVCAFILLGWYAVLGYSNPDALVVRYNLATAENKVQWMEDNRTYIAQDLSDDALLVILENNPPEELLREIGSARPENWHGGLSLTKQRARQAMREYIITDQSA